MTTELDHPAIGKMPAFLVRKKIAPVEIAEPTGPRIPPAVRYSDTVEMYMCEVFIEAEHRSLGAGGQRRFLCVREDDTHAHLLHIATLEHVTMTLRELKDCEIWHGPVPMDVIERLYDKTAQWDMFQFRYSRALVNETLTKLGAEPLPPLPKVPAYLLPANPPPKTGKAPRAPRVIPPPATPPVRNVQPAQLRKPVGAGGKVPVIAALLLREGGCTRQEILTATGWVSVSVHAQTKAAGIGLRIEGGRGNMRYYGLPPAAEVTPVAKAVAKVIDKGKDPARPSDAKRKATIKAMVKEVVAKTRKGKRK